MGGAGRWGGTAGHRLTMSRLNAVIVCSVAIGLVAGSSCRRTPDLENGSAGPPAARGSVRGHVRVSGPVPENDPIRMSADPMCNTANAGRRVLDEGVAAAPDGSLATVFVELVGNFPDAPVPAEPVSIDQKGCVYRPRVIGLRAGQALQVRNSDDGLHNVHGISTDRDGFNVSQPLSGTINTFHPHDPGILRLKCDVHTWMVAFVGVVDHPYFAVTGADGAFAFRDVPAGTYSVRTWHERFGTITTPVHVEGGHDAEAGIDIVYRDTPH
jgi:plastocyanin